MQSTQSPSIQQLQRAVKIAEQIEALEQELKAILGDGAPAPAPAPAAKAPRGNGSAKQASAAKSKPAAKSSGKGKRTMSPETREKIAAAQRARWAKQKG